MRVRREILQELRDAYHTPHALHPHPALSLPLEGEGSIQFDELKSRCRRVARSPLTHPHSGILSCFFQGFSSFLFFSVPSARMMRLRVSRGMITSST